jgi:hypothetical protein
LKYVTGFALSSFTICNTSLLTLIPLILSTSQIHHASGKHEIQKAVFTLRSLVFYRYLLYLDRVDLELVENVEDMSIWVEIILLSYI